MTIKQLLISQTVLLSLFSTQNSYADLKHDSNYQIISHNKQHSQKQKQLNNTQKGTILLNKQQVTTEENTLRCWQDGTLILAEHNWENVVKNNPMLKNRTQQKLYTFDYGETFCVYIGD
ncbi:MAG: hypothetical protein ACRBEE_00345 [Arenicella sp.]